MRRHRSGLPIRLNLTNLVKDSADCLLSSFINLPLLFEQAIECVTARFLDGLDGIRSEFVHLAKVPKVDWCRLAGVLGTKGRSPLITEVLAAGPALILGGRRCGSTAATRSALNDDAP